MSLRLIADGPSARQLCASSAHLLASLADPCGHTRAAHTVSRLMTAHSSARMRVRGGSRLRLLLLSCRTDLPPVPLRGRPAERGELWSGRTTAARRRRAAPRARASERHPPEPLSAALRACLTAFPAVPWTIRRPRPDGRSGTLSGHTRTLARPAVDAGRVPTLPAIPFRPPP